jgi:Peptidase_C39 like family/Tetratricopeptide repeat
VRLPWNARPLAGVLLSAALTSGCALVVPQTAELRDAWPGTLPERIELADVPFFPQEEHQCGPAALATTLRYAGVGITPDELVPQVYLPARRGSLQVEMLSAPRKYGIVSYALAPRLQDVLSEVAAGNPVIVLLDFGVGPIHLWHYADVVGFDRATGEAILRSGRRERLPMPFAVLEYLWKGSKDWSIVTLPPGRVPATAAEAEYAAAITAMARVGGPSASRSAYAAFLARWPDNVEGAIGLASSFYADGELKEAEAVLRDAARRHPDSTPVLNNLAQAISDAGRNEEALEIIDKALEAPGAFAAQATETRALILRRMRMAKPVS